MKIILPGRPITKKNSMNAFPLKTDFAPATSKTRVHCPKCHTRLKVLFNLMQSEQYRNYEKECLWRLKAYKGVFTGKVSLKCLYWMPDRRSEPDLVGLIQATQDILQKAKIIVDDKFIVDLDGSRIMGIDKANPRVEIYIEAVEEGLFCSDM